MKKLFIKNRDSETRYILPFHAEKRIFKNRFSGFIADNAEIAGCCCNCERKYCMRYSGDELYSDFFNSFPHDTSERVCPVEAIEAKGESVVIYTDKCIGCCLCLYRCPFSGIIYDPHTGKCSVTTNGIRQAATPAEHNDQIREYKELPVISDFIGLTIPFISDDALRSVSQYDAEALIIRNYLVNMGIACNSFAKGNQHNRIEFFARQGDKFLLGESETANDVLSVSRRILDDLAVLASRYSVDTDRIVPLAVLNRMPNKRTDFYEVLEDIQKVVNIRIPVITFFGLFLLNLFNRKLNLADFMQFIVNRNHMSIAPYLTRLIPDLPHRCPSLDSEHLSACK